jgi:hypothetical protein
MAAKAQGHLSAFPHPMLCVLQCSSANAEKMLEYFADRKTGQAHCPLVYSFCFVLP